MKISQSITRFDAWEKGSGETRYVADLEVKGLNYGRFYRSPFPRGKIKAVKVPPLPEGYHVVDHRDVPGENCIAMINKDWPAFAVDEVRYIGQIILLLVGPDREVLDRLISGIELEVEALPPLYTMEEAEAGRSAQGETAPPIRGDSNLYADYHLSIGDTSSAFARAARVVEQTCQTGFQEHIYMETQGLLGWWEEGQVAITGSLQCPYYVKHASQVVLGCSEEAVRITQAPTGGGFGGKEDYPEIMGAPLAVAVNKLKIPIRIIFDRVEDISFTSKRHPAKISFRTALDETGEILAMEVDTQLNGGAYESYSCIVLQRAIFHALGVYCIPHARVRGRAWVTNTVPSGAFRGFGAPQALYAIETHMNELARLKGEIPGDFKRRYLIKTGDPTITRGFMKDTIIMPAMYDRIDQISGYRRKAEAYKNHPTLGIGISFFNHGCGFTGDGEQRLIKARAKLRRDEEGRVEILTANVEMGQGVLTTFRKIVAEVLEIPPETIIHTNPDTNRVPNSGPTAASRSVMIVGYLLQEAAKQLKERWAEPGAIEAEAHYTMPPGLTWNQDTMEGDCYPSYGWGINVVEVEVDPETFEVETRGIWAVYDVGVAIDNTIMEGQIEGGMIQGLGYGSLEKLEVKDGKFHQNTMADYTIPTSLDFPTTVSETMENPFEYGPSGAKGAGELVFDGAAPAFSGAVENALGRAMPRIPLTPETIMEVLVDEN